ncbi:MAG TPA: hypothetical protein VFP80_09985 [Thermoanaerobaculia bacterium]|nr:hypothetical protein [Thermoanaerobaculia bacterium]
MNTHAATPERIELREGILVHPKDDVAFVMTPEGGVAAVDLATGVPRWTTQKAAKPLLLVGNRLLCQVQPATAAQRDDLLLAVLDVGYRGKVIARAALDLPDEIVTAVTETPFGHFVLDARSAGTESVKVAWKFAASGKRGTPPRPEQEETAAARPLAAIREFLGSLRINLATGTLEHVQETETSAPSALDSLVDGSDTDEQPGTQYRSADGRMLVTSERIADDREWNNYRWTVMDTANGEQLGEIRTYVAFAPFVVRRGVLVMETKPYIRGGAMQPAMLRGYDLATGNEQWTFAVREIVFRGPTPP